MRTTITAQTNLTHIKQKKMKEYEAYILTQTGSVIYDQCEAYNIQSALNYFCAKHYGCEITKVEMLNN